MTAEAEQHEDEYTPELITFLETIWGEGYLSPGGPQEVAQVLDGIDLSGKTVLDIGCGTGGIPIELVETYGAAHVTGIDIEGAVVDEARRRAGEKNLSDRLTFIRVEPGPLPFDDGTFEVVFSKDAMIHIADKESLFRDIHRVLKPGGIVAASDWLIGHDDEPSPEMKHYLEMEGLSFGMASPARYRTAMEAAGFEDVRLVDRNPWYREVAAEELRQIAGPLYDEAVAAAGKETVDHNIGTWRAMLAVLETGEHCPHHLFGRKPA